jgi:aminopeptidase N
MTKTVLFTTTILIFLFGSVLLAAPRPDSPPRCSHALPDHDLVHQFRLLEGESRSTRLLPHLLNREPEEMTFYDVTRYELDLEVYTDDEFITGEVLMEFVGAVTQLDTLLFHAGTNITLYDITQDETPLDFSRDGQFISVTLNEPLMEGESSSLLINYLADRQGSQGMMYATEYNVQLQQDINIRSTQSEPFDARLWWPCKDDTRDKATTTRISVRTEEYNDVVSNGILQDDISHGDGTHTVIWEEQWPMVTYLVSICVAPYNHIETDWVWEDIVMPMHDWSWSYTVNQQLQWIDFGLDALTALSDLYGCYPYADEKYGHAEYLWGGAMEHQTCSSMGFYNDWVIAHELAHQWFGDKLTCDTFHHIWLNEGWASYSEALYFEYWLGEDALHDYMIGESYWGEGTIWIEDPENDNIFDGNLSYRKASWVNHMLRHVVGEDNFWNAVHAYIGPSEPEYHRTVTTDEYRGFMEEASGMDLQYFFDQWIMGEFFPEYAYFWEVESEGGEHTLIVNLLQEQVPDRQTFTMPVDLVVTLPFHGDTTLRLWNNEAAQRYEFLFEEEPQVVELDPNHWILREVTQLPDLPIGFVMQMAGFEDSDGTPLVSIPPQSDFQFRSVVRNSGPDASVVTATLLCDNDLVEITTAPIELGEMDFAQYSDTLLFEAHLGDIEAELGEFTLLISADELQFAFELEIYLGNPNLLLVDDDGGDEYETWLIDALADWAFFQVIEPVNLTSDILSASELVIWMQGDQVRELENEERELLSTYLESGGHIVFTGQNFAQGQSTLWLEDFCGAEITNDDFFDQTTWGDAGGYLEGQSIFLMGGGAGNQTEMDQLLPTGDDAAPLLHYFIEDVPGNAAVVKNYASEGAVALFGFGWEGVSPSGIGLSLQELTEVTWDWALGIQAVPEAPVVPDTPLISATYPNPFNPTLTIEYYIPQPGQTQLLVYNILGERVALLMSGFQSSGAAQIHWDAGDLAGGVYFVQLRQGERQMTRKVMLLK